MTLPQVDDETGLATINVWSIPDRAGGSSNLETRRLAVEVRAGVEVLSRRLAGDDRLAELRRLKCDLQEQLAQVDAEIGNLETPRQDQPPAQAEAASGAEPANVEATPEQVDALAYSPKVRAWAKENDLPNSRSGRNRRDAVQAYLRAHQAEGESA